MLKILICITLFFFNYNLLKANGLDAFLTGLLQGLTENMEKDSAKEKIKGSKDDFKIHSKFSGCISYVEGQSKYLELNIKSPFPSQMKSEHLNDKSFVNQDEKDFIIAYIQEVEKCIERTRPQKIFNKSSKSLFLTSQIIWSENILDFIKLYNQEITWGTLNRNIKQRSIQYSSYVNNWEILTDAQLREEYDKINNYWNDWNNQRRSEQQAIFNNYLNKNKNRCWKKEVYDKNGKKKIIKTCGNPYMMDLN